MSRFLQIHILTSYPPSNLNRDDLGRPKTAVMGGVTRLRISSQSLKRAWRTSEIFESHVKKEHVGTRTKEMGVEIFQVLQSKGVAEADAMEWAKTIASTFGKPKKAKNDKPLEELKIEQLAHFTPEEKTAIDRLIEQLAQHRTAPTEADLALLVKDHTAADVALFGRMLAGSPRFNAEAAAQVAHAITVHPVTVEDDFFTAVDDLNRADEDMGAGHMGETEFGAGVFYLYLCIDCQSLLRNLGDNSELVKRVLSGLVESAAKVSPAGKQNSFASRAYASYILAEKGDKQPRSLSVAFLKPVEGDNILSVAIERLQNTRVNIDKVYGACAERPVSMNTLTGEGTLAAVIDFAKGCVS